MGYINDLKKCSNANDYQNVFDNEVRRLRNLTILRNDDQKLSERVNRLKKEIEDVTYTLVQDDSRYTLRIPQDAIDANPGLLN